MHASRESFRKKSLSNGGRASGAIGILHQAEQPRAELGVRSKTWQMPYRRR
jgi:hypothetical protein